MQPQNAFSNGLFAFIWIVKFSPTQNINDPFSLLRDDLQIFDRWLRNMITASLHDSFNVGEEFYFLQIS